MPSAPLPASRLPTRCVRSARRRKTGVPACVPPHLSVGRRERKTQLSDPRRSRQGEKGTVSSRIIFRWWKISLRSEYRSAKPGETKETHGDFLDNSHLQVQVAVVFGAKILDYVFNLCEGKFDYLERLSDKLLLKIICYLDLEDIARLAQTSSRFEKLCKSDSLWEQIVQSACDTITPDMRALAKDVGWRQMFFTNKIQLQRQIRKKKQKQEKPEKQT